MDKYKKLMSNTVIFAIGTFSSKLLTFFLVPYYTRVLTNAEYGIGDLLVQTSNLIIPIVSIGISNAIIRYGLDSAVSKRHVFTGGLTAIGCGYGLFVLLYPLMAMIPLNVEVRSRLYLVYIFVLTSCLRTLCAQFVRAKQFVKLYAFDGLLSTITVILFSVLFLSVFKMGVVGFVLATICSDFLSALFLFTIAGLRRYIRFSTMEWDVLGSMLRFAIPLIPANVFWWITNVSDHYLITHFNGPAANGLYVVSYKIPTMLILVSGIFTDAWQMSALTENGPGRDRFYTKVFRAYMALIFTAASGLILMAKPIIHILASKSSYLAWQFVPLLVISSVFSCFVTFLGSVYMVEKKSMRTLLTTAAGAVINIILNLLLIPRFEQNGAAFATFFSYFLVFILRIIDTRRYVKIRWNPFLLTLNLAILLGQTTVLLLVPELEKWVLYEVLLCGLMILVNLRQLLINAQKFLQRRHPASGR